ncbi:hypothetical protein SUGI_0453780 [Cryptomeria japonica]|uniref:APO protein 2, chloroplastic n=1 Tax=Cryptomeria japonica TaxID=3369 RepID=UPI0024089462|nr:APO protein 2, chloroplastic [Cryptomeria japonica]GLJ23881.1 hypothetical protein SUGI_0453780 [Cryptomeria japonica]
MGTISFSYVNGLSRPAYKPVYTNFSSGRLLYGEFHGPPNWKKWGISSNSQNITLRLVLFGSLDSKVHQFYKQLVITGEYPQNVDLPYSLPVTKKKPFPVPVKELRRAARERQKNNKGKPKRPLGPPRNGLLVQGLIPVAHQVFEARMRLINGISELLKVVHVRSCRHCSEVHVGPVGHPFKTCHGFNFGARNSLHEWGNSYIEDILVPLESFHLFDRLGRRVTHEERFSIQRIPSVVELCIQAGSDLPQYPTRRRVEPIYYFHKEMVDPNEDEAANNMQKTESTDILDLYEPTQQTSTAYSSSEEIKNLAEETLQAWFTMRQGANKLMKKYPVKVCGYCPEVHVGPFGHRARLCGEYKHQQRDGMHGWQTATIEDLIPPKYVWHVPDPHGPPFRNELRRFYGQAPAIVELCVQAGAAIPEEYKPMMRLDVVIPDYKEIEMVA